MKWCLLKTIYDLDEDIMGVVCIIFACTPYPIHVHVLVYIEPLPAITPHDISPPKNMDTPLVAFKARVEAK